jgi:predicted RNase H-like HicB family nuclease
MATYRTIIWQEEEIWTAHAPAVPGVYGVGATPKAASNDLAGALHEMFDYLDEIDEEHPAPAPVRFGEINI